MLLRHNGPTGALELYFLDRYTKFANITREELVEAGPASSRRMLGD